MTMKFPPLMSSRDGVHWTKVEEPKTWEGCINGQTIARHSVPSISQQIFGMGEAGAMTATQQAEIQREAEAMERQAKIRAIGDLLGPCGTPRYFALDPLDPLGTRELEKNALYRKLVHAAANQFNFGMTGVPTVPTPPAPPHDPRSTVGSCGVTTTGTTVTAPTTSTGTASSGSFTISKHLKDMMDAAEAIVKGHTIRVPLGKTVSVPGPYDPNAMSGDMDAMLDAMCAPQPAKQEVAPRDKPIHEMTHLDYAKCCAAYFARQGKAE